MSAERAEDRPMHTKIFETSVYTHTLYKKIVILCTKDLHGRCSKGESYGVQQAPLADLYGATLALPCHSLPSTFVARKFLSSCCIRESCYIPPCYIRCISFPCSAKKLLHFPPSVMVQTALSLLVFYDYVEVLGAIGAFSGVSSVAIRTVPLMGKTSRYLGCNRHILFRWVYHSCCICHRPS